MRGSLLKVYDMKFFSKRLLLTTALICGLGSAANAQTSQQPSGNQSSNSSFSEPGLFTKVYGKSYEELEIIAKNDPEVAEFLKTPHAPKRAASQQVQQKPQPRTQFIRSGSKKIDENGRCTAQLNDTIYPQDYKALHKSLRRKSKDVKKGKYETATDYEARMSKVEDKQYIVAVPFNAEYDPEKEYYKIAEHPDLKKMKFSFFSISPSAAYGIYLSYNKRKVKETAFSNGWGDTWTEDTYQGEIYALYDRTAPTRSARDARGKPGGENPLMFEPDFIVTKKVKGAYRINYYRSGFLKLPMSRSVAQVNDGKLKVAYVFTPKGIVAKTRRAEGPELLKNHQMTVNVFEGNIHCAIFLDKDSRVLKVAPVAYNSMVNGKGFE